jgi:hypothetical protein
LVLFEISPFWSSYWDILPAYDNAITYARGIRFEQTLQYSGRFKLLFNLDDKTKPNQNQEKMNRTPGQSAIAHEKFGITELISYKKAQYPRTLKVQAQYNGADPQQHEGKVNQLER